METIKEEKKADLEQLLNSLIEKGWRIENLNARISDIKYMYGLRELRIVYETDRRDAVRNYPIRFLVSKESNLWQFVCENKFVKTKDRKVRFMYEDLERTQNYFSWHGYEYRLIESSLKDESELEDFLLQSIVINND